jgi:hypothetical protein
MSIEFVFHLYLCFFVFAFFASWMVGKATKIGYLLKFVWRSDPQGALIAEQPASNKMQQKYSNL